MCRPALLHALSGTGSARARRAQMQSKAKKIMRKSGMQRGKKRLKTRGDDLSWEARMARAIVAVNTTVHGRHAVPCRGMAGDGKLKRCGKGERKGTVRGKDGGGYGGHHDG